MHMLGIIIYTLAIVIHNRIKNRKWALVLSIMYVFVVSKVIDELHIGVTSGNKVVLLPPVTIGIIIIQHYNEWYKERH